MSQIASFTGTSTIAALASGSDPSGIAVIRISGPETKRIFSALFRSKKDPVKNPRLVCYGSVIDFQTAEPIDCALAFFMPSPHSFTGEDTGELHVHGSPILVRRILRSLFAFGVLPAEPGEFSRRAYLNGKLDLVQAEAIADLISASSEEALKIAGENLSGKLSSAVTAVGGSIKQLLMKLEALIDFSEEELPHGLLDDTAITLEDLGVRLDKLIGTSQYGHIVREGFKILLCGRPNAGKSSIFNALLNKPRAIVSDISGTTRDLIEEQLQIGGFKVVICDSAGICQTDNKVESLGIELAYDRLEWADLVCFVLDATDTTQEWLTVLTDIRAKSPEKTIWLVVNKIDQDPSAIGRHYCSSDLCLQNIYISATSDDGVEALRDAIKSEITGATSKIVRDSVVVTKERHRSALLRAHEAINKARLLVGTGQFMLEILVEDLKEALLALEDLIGKTTSDDILNMIFSEFCIGK